ncbi:MAG: hypothetical protein KGI06_05235 [Candidatus Micrarchaeota archaeon]|nr:hypothetical protein [Candidatus Micrarchaeota archaeon]
MRNGIYWKISVIALMASFYAIAASQLSYAIGAGNLLTLAASNSVIYSGATETFTLTASCQSCTGPLDAELYNVTGASQQDGNVLLMGSAPTFTNTISIVAGATGNFMFNAMAYDAASSTLLSSGYTTITVLSPTTTSVTTTESTSTSSTASTSSASTSTSSTSSSSTASTSVTSISTTAPTTSTSVSTTESTSVSSTASTSVTTIPTTSESTTTASTTASTTAPTTTESTSVPTTSTSLTTSILSTATTSSTSTASTTTEPSTSLTTSVSSTTSVPTTSTTIPSNGFATRTPGFWKNDHNGDTTCIFNSVLGGTLTINGLMNPPVVYTSATDLIAAISPHNQFLFQLISAKLNCAAFGCNASTQGLIALADSIYGTNSPLIGSVHDQLSAYDSSGESITPQSNTLPTCWGGS